MIKRRLFALLLAAAASAGFSTAWGQGVDITIDSDGTASPSTYSSTRWIGIDGSRPTIPVNEVNSIATASPASEEVCGIRHWSGSTLSVGSLSGGITLEGTAAANAIYLSASDASLLISDINQLKVTSSSNITRGIYNKGTVTLTASDCSIYSTAAITAYGIFNTGTVTATLSSIYASATDNAYGIFCNSSGTATVTVDTISASTGDTATAVKVQDNSAVTLLAKDNNPISVTGHIDIASGCTLNIGYAGIAFASGTGSKCINEGTILVDMTGATEDSYTLIDAASTLTCTYGTYQFAAGKDNGYLLKVEGNDLIAYKAQPLSVTVGETGYATIYSDSKLSIPEGVTVLDYSFDGTNFNLNASYTEGTLAGVRGYVITAKPGKYEFAVSTGTPLDCKSCLKGCTTETTAPAGTYVFDIIDGIPGFYKFTGTLAAGKAYYREDN